VSIVASEQAAALAAARRTELREVIASAAGVDPEDVALVVSTDSGRTTLVFVISVEGSTSEVASTISQRLASVDAASSLLGMDVLSVPSITTPESDLPPALPPPSPYMPRMVSAQDAADSGGGGAVMALIVVAAVIAAICYLLYKNQGGGSKESRREPTGEITCTRHASEFAGGVGVEPGYQVDNTAYGYNMDRNSAAGSTFEKL